MRIPFLFLMLTVALSAKQPVLVELFTSEGCSSCPTADKLLAELESTQPVDSAQIIVLSEHVDYWNHIGWRDPFSSAQFSARQGSYATQFNLESVYTPQAVIGGREQFVGSDRKQIIESIKRAASAPSGGVQVVSAVLRGGEVVAEVESKAGAGQLWVALATDRTSVAVQKGENSGKTLSHVSVVRQLVSAGHAGEGRKTIRLKVPPQSGGLRVVAFLQQPKSIGAAAMLAVTSQP